MREAKVHFYDWTLHEKGRALCGIDIFTLRRCCMNDQEAVSLSIAGFEILARTGDKW
jgi:hypothetical protein